MLLVILGFWSTVAVTYWGNQKITRGFSTAWERVGTPNPHVVQESTVYIITLYLMGEYIAQFTASV